MSKTPMPFGLPIENSIVVLPYDGDIVVSIYVPEKCEDYMLGFMVERAAAGYGQIQLKNRLAPLPKICTDLLLAESRDVPFICDVLSYDDDLVANTRNTSRQEVNTNAGYAEGEDSRLGWEEPKSIRPRVRTLTDQAFIRQHPADYFECLVDDVQTIFVRNQPFRLAEESYLKFSMLNGSATRPFTKEDYVLNPELKCAPANIIHDIGYGGLKERNVILYGVVNNSDLRNMEPVSSGDEFEIDKDLMAEDRTMTMPLRVMYTR